MVTTANFRLRMLTAGFWVSRAISTSVELGLYDCIRDSRPTFKEVLGSLSVSERGLEVLVRFNLAFGLLTVDGGGRLLIAEEYREFLNSALPGYIGPTATISDDVWRSFERLTKQVTEGEVDVASDYFQCLSDAEVFGFFNTMASQAASASRQLALRMDLSRVNRLLDVGCGPAINSLDLVRSNNKLEIILFDTPRMMSHLRREVFALPKNLRDRITLVEGDFNTSEMDLDYDGLLLSKIMHDWDDRRCSELLAKFAGPHRGQVTLFIHEEMIVSEARPAPWPALIDLFIFCRMGRGRTRTIAELKGLLDIVDFRICTIAPVDELTSLLTAIPSR